MNAHVLKQRSTEEIVRPVIPREEPLIIQESILPRESPKWTNQLATS